MRADTFTATIANGEQEDYADDGADVDSIPDEDQGDDH